MFTVNPTLAFMPPNISRKNGAQTGLVCTVVTVRILSLQEGARTLNCVYSVTNSVSEKHTHWVRVVNATLGECTNANELSFSLCILHSRPVANPAAMHNTHTSLLKGSP